MPEPFIRMRALRKKYTGGLARGNLEAIYSAYSKFNRKAYNRIIVTAPRSRTPSSRWPVGFVSSHIKLVQKRRRGGYSYWEVDVPGKSHKGSRAWRAWLAIQTLHQGWKRLPFVRRPTRRKALKFPVIPGMTVPQRKGRRDYIIARKAIQRRQARRNPWIKRAFEALEPMFPRILEEELKNKERRLIKEKIV